MLQKKIKLLYVLDILKRTDEQHPITTNQIVSKLQAYGIDAERKSVLRDINMLRDEYGCEIELSEDNKLGYYMAGREFEDWEIKLLCDAAAGAKFLTEKDRRILIDKLCLLSSEAVGKQIKNSTIIRDKYTQKRETKNNIDVVMRAIASHKKITFQYADTQTDMQEGLKRRGLIYKVSPYAVAWKDDAYHLYGCYDEKTDISVYRLDRMRGTQIIDEKSLPLASIYKDAPYEQLRAYIEKSVYNYNGDTIYVTLKTQPKMLNSIKEQFGESIHTRQCDGYIEVVVPTVDSAGLYFWLMKYGLTVTVLEPVSIREKMIQNYKTILFKNYK